MSEIITGRTQKCIKKAIAHDSAHAKVKKTILIQNILEYVDEIGIILNDFKAVFTQLHVPIKI